MSWAGETRQYKGTGVELVSSESRMREQMASRQNITSEKQWNYLASCHFSNRGCGGQFKLFAMLSHFYFEEVILMLICYFWLEKGMATTPVFLPGEFHGRRNLYSSWGCPHLIQPCGVCISICMTSSIGETVETMEGSIVASRGWWGWEMNTWKTEDPSSCSTKKMFCIIPKLG